MDVFLKRDSQTDFILLTSPPAVIFSLNANGTFFYVWVLFFGCELLLRFIFCSDEIL